MNETITIEKISQEIENGMTLEQAVERFGGSIVDDYEHGNCFVPEFAPINAADESGCDMSYQDCSSEKAANEYVKDGDWGYYPTTLWVNVSTWREGIKSDGCVENVDYKTHKIQIDPKEPDCVDDQGHDWQSPYEIVGGIKDNPGVWGNGGGLIINECCMNCGYKKTTDTWAQDPSTGEQGLTSVSYEEYYYELPESEDN